MLVRGAIDMYGIKIPGRLAERVDMRSTIELLPHECDAINIALDAMAKEFDRRPPLIRNSALLVFIPGSGLSLTYDENALGVTKSVLVFRVGLWRQLYPGSDSAPILSVIEEMCHCFYGIADETEVKHMVSDIVRRYINPDKTFETLFPNWPAG